MHLHRQRLRIAGCLCFLLAALTLLAGALFWTPLVERLFRSRLFVELLGVWCGVCGTLLYTGLRAGLAQGIRNFRDATRDVIRDMRGDDGDDGPHAA